MKSTSQNYENYNPANKRTIALALLISFIAVSLLSGAFILMHTDHDDGTHGSCATCVQIQNAENVLRLLGTVAALSFTLFAGYYTTAMRVRTIYSNIAALTPITAKTRMNN